MKIPNKSEVLDFIRGMGAPVSKRELTKAFRIKGDARRVFKLLLSQMEKEELIKREPGQTYTIPKGLPSVATVEIIEISIEGEVYAKPLDWDTETKGPAPQIELISDRKNPSALKKGDKAFVRLRRISDEFYEAKSIKRIEDTSGQVIGLVVEEKRGFVLRPADKKARNDFQIDSHGLNGAKDGDLAIGEPQSSSDLRRQKVRITKIIGNENDVRAVSILSLHEAGLKEEFPQSVLKQTEGMVVPPLENRTDLRQIPLVTIDGADARDYDDAVFAEIDTDPQNQGGFHLLVAIADVAHYVHHGTTLDKEAWTRGNSTYFPDRVVPMLPEQLSNNLCSLMPKVDRACMAIHMWINKHGELIRQKPVRGIMKSAARLTYEQVQVAYNGQTDDTTDPLMAGVIRPLYAAYDVLKAAKQKRGALDLDLPEKQITINDQGEMTGVRIRDRLDSHMLIEEFMVLANVAAAQLLEAKKAPCVYRVHDKPAAEKLDNARDFLKTFDLDLPHSVVEPKEINQLLVKSKDHPYAPLISTMILRTQAKAIYSPENIGHFGLALKKYAHFTSPIRRYADLIVHRSLIKAYGLGSGALEEGDAVRIDETCDHISATERNSADAERNAVDRFTAIYLSERVDAEFEGLINGVTRFGLFVTLKENGADGLVPIRSLPDDFYIHDEQQHALIGRRTKIIFRMGATVQTKIAEVDGLTGGTILEIIDPHKGADIPGFKLTKSNAVEEDRRGKPDYKKKKFGAKKYGPKNGAKKTSFKHKKPR